MILQFTSFTFHFSRWNMIFPISDMKNSSFPAPDSFIKQIISVFTFQNMIKFTIYPRYMTYCYVLMLEVDNSRACSHEADCISWEINANYFTASPLPLQWPKFRHRGLEPGARSWIRNIFCWYLLLCCLPNTLENWFCTLLTTPPPGRGKMLNLWKLHGGAKRNNFFWAEYFE